MSTLGIPDYCTRRKRFFFNIVELLVSTWTTWSGVNVLYHSGTNSQRTNRWGCPLCDFTWFMRSGGYMYIRIYIYIHIRKVDSQLQSRIRLHVPKDSFLIYNCVPRKLKRHSSQNQNADIRHLLDSLVSALAVYATAFRSKLSLEGFPQKRERSVSTEQ